jgi:hypothetical protein
MILGLSLPAFTTVHVAISLVGIASGIVVVLGMAAGHRLPGWTALFLATTILTSVSGFLFPFTQILPSHILGAISLVVLAVALIARYGFRLGGAWRWVYVVSAVLAFYFNAFVGVVQAFQKLPFLQALAPTQSEPPFAVAQAALLVVLAVLGFLAVRRFRPVAAPA